MAENIIVSEGLVKIYKSTDVEVMALQGLDLEVEEGELMAIIGKSGSGKSTFLNMIGGLEKPSAGRLYVDGKDLFKMSQGELIKYKKSTVGFVWQKNSRNLFPYLTALQNVEVPMQFSDNRKKKRDRAIELLDEVGVLKKKDSLLSEMSGGEQQRVAIAIALANSPRILLADEPTGAVDMKTSNYIQDMFRAINREKKTTIIIVTHDLTLSRKVNRVVMIRDGKISGEKIARDSYRDRLEHMETIGNLYDTSDTHEEYVVMDRAGRIQLTSEIRSEAGIEGNRVRLHVSDGKIIITGGEEK